MILYGTHLNKSGICILCGLLFILYIYYVSNKNNAKTLVVMKNINLRQLLKVAIKATQNGGKEVIQTKDNIIIKSKGLTKEGLIDSVTTADFLSHCSMFKTIKYYFPSITVISEEAKTLCEETQSIDYTLFDTDHENLSDEYIEAGDVTIWLDPLDATKEYTEKLYSYVTVMVCVAVKGKPLIGVIHKPFSNTTSWAWVKKAKSQDLNVRKTKQNNKDLKIVISMSHQGKIREVLGRSEKFQLISAAGAGYKVLEVATGNVDAYLHITAIKKWDICAGNAIINAQGGKMTTKFNKEINYTRSNGFINEDGLITTMENHDFFVGML